MEVVSHTGDGPALLASYPSSSSVWTVKADGVFKSTAFSIRAFAICLNTAP